MYNNSFNGIRKKMKVICNRRHNCRHRHDCGGAQPHIKCSECGDCHYDKEAKCLSLEEDSKLEKQRRLDMDIRKKANAKIEAQKKDMEARVIKKKVKEFLSDGKSFTSVDIGNSIKDDAKVFIRNTRVAEWLRKNFTRVAYENAKPYNSTLIQVDAGRFMTKAYLYHHNLTSADTYLDRDQFAKVPRR